MIKKFTIIFLATFFVSINSNSSTKNYVEGVWGLCGQDSPFSYEAQWASRNLTLQVCDGSITTDKILSTCSKLVNGSFSETVSNSFCSHIASPSETFLSPAGTITLSDSQYLVNHGRYEKTCIEGDSIGTISSLICDEGYNAQGSSCELSQLVITNLKSEFATQEQGLLLAASNIGISSITGSGYAASGSGVSATGLLGTLSTSQIATKNNELASSQELLTNVYFTGETSSNTPTLSSNFHSQNGETILSDSINVINSKFSFNILQSSILNLTNIINWSIDLFAPGFSNTSTNFKKTKYIISQLMNINGSSFDGVKNITSFNNEVYFVANRLGAGEKLFKYNQQTKIITQLSNIRTAASDAPALLTVFKNELYFAANNVSGVSKLFKINTSGVITQISNIRGATSTDVIQELIVYKDNLIISSVNAAGSRKLFKYDGISSQITTVSQISASDENIRNFKIYKNNLYFTAAISSNLKIYRYNGTTITQISNITNAGNDNPTNLEVFNDELYFSALISGRSKLFRYDESNIYQVSNTSIAGNDDPQSLTEFKGDLYFVSKEDSSSQIYKYIRNTNQIVKITNGSSLNIESPKLLQVYKDELYFTATNQNGLEKLFKYNKDSNQVSQISDLNPNQNEYPTVLKSIGDELLYSAIGSSFSNKLYKVEKIVEE